MTSHSALIGRGAAWLCEIMLKSDAAHAATRRVFDKRPRPFNVPRARARHKSSAESSRARHSWYRETLQLFEPRARARERAFGSSATFFAQRLVSALISCRAAGPAPFSTAGGLLTHQVHRLRKMRAWIRREAHLDGRRRGRWRALYVASQSLRFCGGIALFGWSGAL